MVERNMGDAVMRGIASSCRGRGPHHAHEDCIRKLGCLVPGRRRRVCSEYGGPHREGEEP
jgi:hypothetical protein